MVIYVPGTEETDPKKQNMSLQQLGGATSTNTTNIATNTANIATNTTNIATNAANISTLQSTVSGITPTTFTIYDVPAASFVTMVSGTPKTVVSGSFAAGAWLVQGNIVWSAQGSTAYTELHQSLSLTDNTHETSPAGGSTFADHLTWATGQFSVRPTGLRYFSLSVTTTIYLVGTVTNTGSAMLAYGDLWGIKLP